MKILIAEDERTLNQILSDSIAESGHEVIQAYDGEDALEKMRDEKPDLVTLDILMPKKNGIQVLQEMQQDPELKKIPVIVDTASMTNASEDQCLEAGAWKFIIKSKDTPRKILELIEETKK